MLVRDAIAQARSLVTGSMIDEVSVLLTDYNPSTDPTITLKYPRKSTQVGTTLSVGLNTLTVMSVSGDGATMEVMPQADGGPAVPVSSNEVVRLKPHFTTWAIYRELANEIQNLSTPDTGLYWVDILEASAIDRVSGMYQIPDRDDGLMPLRLLKAEFRLGGTSAWQTFAEAEYQTATNRIRVFYDPPGLIEYRFHMAYPFGDLTGSLDQELNDIGIYDAIQNIPIFGIASTMAMGWEGRRMQPLAQGDARRPTEVQVGASIGLSRLFAQRQKDEIAGELSRLTRMYGWRISGTTGATGRYGYGTGWR